MKFLRNTWTKVSHLRDLLDIGEAVRYTMNHTGHDGGALERLDAVVSQHETFVASLVEKLHEKGVLTDDDVAALVDTPVAPPELVEKLEARARMPRS